MFVDFAVRGFFEADDYEIHLREANTSDVSFSDISPLSLGFTLCFWLKTSYPGFFIEYKMASELGESLLLGFYSENNTFKIQLDKRSRYRNFCCCCCCCKLFSINVCFSELFYHFMFFFLSPLYSCQCCEEAIS